VSRLAQNRNQDGASVNIVDDLRTLAILDDLTAKQLDELVAAGVRVPFVPGEDLFEEGHPADFWWLVVRGSLDLMRRMGREYTVVGRMPPGRWAGGFKAWDERAVYLATGHGAESGWVLRLPATELARLTGTWFPFGNHLIKGLYGTARTIEATARQRETMVSLGTLAAGLAHEINNPAAAATRAVADLETACATVRSSIGRLALDEISAQELAGLDRLRGELRPPEIPLSPLAMSDLEDELAGWLEDHHVDDAWTVAPVLAAAGADLEWCRRAAALLSPKAVEPGLEWVASTLAVTSLLADVRVSTARISELIGAVRSYSQMDRASLQVIDVTEGLESTLTMLGRQVRSGITVVRDYDPDVPRIEAYAGELNQVWTNLIDNAADAMSGGGTLRLRTRTEDDQVVVEIGDTGVGMTPEVAARAFDAFFTTKEVGRGAGLGLDVARRIVVDRHGGDIGIESRPGETVLWVRLPVRVPRP
jgi:signal transduction histidine kinase